MIAPNLQDAERQAIMRLLQPPQIQPTEAPLGGYAERGTPEKPGSAPTPYAMPTAAKRGR